ncbi:hypothetical protein EEY24_00685 (plasmid) [Shewanella algae]|nr:hypothetical protein EEY24_00685 [Shewanella algae]
MKLTNTALNRQTSLQLSSSITRKGLTKQRRSNLKIILMDSTSSRVSNGRSSSINLEIITKLRSNSIGLNVSTKLRSKININIIMVLNQAEGLIVDASPQQGYFPVGRAFLD